MIYVTAEQAQQIEEALEKAEFKLEVRGMRSLVITEALATIRAARAQEQAEQQPVALLQLAESALVYHTEQTRPIQNTIDVLAAIQKFKEKQR